MKKSIYTFFVLMYSNTNKYFQTGGQVYGKHMQYM